MPIPTLPARRTVLRPAASYSHGHRFHPPVPGTSERAQQLILRKGPGWPAPRAFRFPTHRNRMTLGRGDGCLAKVKSPLVSPMHAALVRRPRRGVYLRDLSGVGTYLNGERITQDVLLVHGDVIGLGPNVELEYRDGKERLRTRMRRWIGWSG